MSDRRDEILDKETIEACLGPTQRMLVKYAMDEWMKECVLLAFEFVAHETTGHSMNETTNELEFKYKGEWISREKLFENFL